MVATLNDFPDFGNFGNFGNFPDFDEQKKSDPLTLRAGRSCFLGRKWVDFGVDSGAVSVRCPSRGMVERLAECPRNALTGSQSDFVRGMVLHIGQSVKRARIALNAFVRTNKKKRHRVGSRRREFGHKKSPVRIARGNGSVIGFSTFQR